MFFALRISCGLLALCVLLASPSAHAQRSSNESFGQILLRMVELRQLVLQRTPEDGIERAEGFRQIMRQLAQATELHLDDHDFAHPKIGRCPSQNCKLGQDNPDNTYMAFQLSDAHSYRVFGQRNDAFGLFQTRTSVGLSESNLTTDDLIVAPDGSYQIFLSPDPPPGGALANWIQTTPDTRQFLVRLYYDDWDRDIEPGLQIEVVGDADGDQSVDPLTPDYFEERVDELVSYMNFFDIFASRPDTFPVNGITVPRPPGPFGNPNVTNARGRWDLGEDEALILTREVSAARYINIQLSNLWWTSIDYATRQSSLSGAQTHVDSDGKIRYVIARSDPGAPNWLDATGRQEGTIHVRWVLADPADPPRALEAQVVPLAELWNHLPADHPEVSVAERSQVIQRRQASYMRRLNPQSTAVVDMDGDGEIDSGDRCLDTEAGAAVDDAGCSNEQFCDAIDVDTWVGRRTCLRADWNNDEPLTSVPRDCIARRDDCVAPSALWKRIGPIRMSFGGISP